MKAYVSEYRGQPKMRFTSQNSQAMMDLYKHAKAYEIIQERGNYTGLLFLKTGSVTHNLRKFAIKEEWNMLQKVL